MRSILCRLVLKDKKAEKLTQRECSVVISLPRRYSLGDVELVLGSGEATICPLACSNLCIELEGGTLNFEGLDVKKKFTLEMEDGKFTVNKLEADSITAECKKGLITMNKIATKLFNFNLEKGNGDLIFDSPFTKDSKVTVGSSTVVVSLPSSFSFLCLASLDKGELRSEFNLDSKGPHLQAKVGKGSLKILKQ